MKLTIALTFLLLSTTLFAATPYSFKCTTSSDGKCSITNSNAHVMTLMQNGIYGGTEGEYKMYFSPEDGSSYLFVYKGQTELAQAEGSYLAVPTQGGYAGVIIVDSVTDIPAFIQPKL